MSKHFQVSDFSLKTAHRKLFRAKIYPPAMNMLSSSIEPAKTKTVIEYSSGSTVISISVMSRVFYGINDTRAFISNKTSEAKLKLMQFFGLGM